MKKLISFADPYVSQPLRWPRDKTFGEGNNVQFFLSFGDAFLYLARAFHFTKETTTMLVPDFYCPSTLLFFEERTHLIFYKIHADFSPDMESYFRQITTRKPRVILNYSFCGFSLTKEERERLRTSCGEDTIIIEDYAHRILRKEDVQPLHKNHMYIDSIRKTSPLLGSHLVWERQSEGGCPIARMNGYKILCTFLHIVHEFLSTLAYALRSRVLFGWSERVFLEHDKYIGAPKQPTGGWGLSALLWQHIDHSAIAQHQRNLALEYHARLKDLDHPDFHVLHEKNIEHAILNFFPIFVAPDRHEALLHYLAKKNIFIDKLWDTSDVPHLPLHKNIYDTMLILPLAWIITSRDVEDICNALKAYFNET